jgi:hypothetical protein
MRLSLSRTAESARPTIVKRGKPAAASASTRTRWASAPRTAAVSDVDSKGASPRPVPDGDAGSQQDQARLWRAGRERGWDDRA